MTFRSCRLAATLFTLAPVSGVAQATVDEAARRDQTELTTGLVVGLYHDGDIQFLDAWGTARHGHADPLTTDALFPFSGLTEILIATTVRALAASGAIDDHGPIGAYLPDIPAELGSVTLNQLLTHSAGLDDAQPAEGQTWREATERLSARTLMTEPGVIYSASRYSYLLAGRVLERVTNLSLPEVITTAFLEPLGMDRSTFRLEEARRLGVAQGYAVNTDASRPVVEVVPATESEGLPVLYTTVQDVIRLVVALLDGSVEVGMPMDRQGTFHNPISGIGFVDGFRIAEYRGVPRAYRSSSGLGFGAYLSILPRTRTVLVAWANGIQPRSTINFIQDRIAASLELGARAPRAPNPEPEELDTSEDRSAWAGTYLNGDFIVVLKYEQDSLLFFNGVQDLPAAPLRNGVMAARVPDGRVGVTFRLIELDGRRFVFLGDKAYAMQAPSG